MKRILIKLIKIYQRMPLKSHGQCRFYPTCSEYMIISLEQYGLFKGLYLGIKRLLRCRPFGKKVYDPVPCLCKETNK